MIDQNSQMKQKKQDQAGNIINRKDVQRKTPAKMRVDC